MRKWFMWAIPASLFFVSYFHRVAPAVISAVRIPPRVASNSRKRPPLSVARSAIARKATEPRSLAAPTGPAPPTPAGTIVMFAVRVEVRPSSANTFCVTVNPPAEANW